MKVAFEHNMANRSTVSGVWSVYYKCQMNLSSKHSTLLKVEVTHRRAAFSSIAEFANKKNWLDAFLALTSCQCGFFAHHRHVHIQITACRQMWRGGAKQELKSKAFSGFWWPWCFHPYFDVHSCEAVLPLPSSHCFHRLRDGTLL